MGIVLILELKGYSERVQGRMPRGIPGDCALNRHVEGEKRGNNSDTLLPILEY